MQQQKVAPVCAACSKAKGMSRSRSLRSVATRITAGRIQCAGCVAASVPRGFSVSVIAFT